MTQDVCATILLFSYGTLRLAEVQMATFGRLLDGAPDALSGFRLSMIEITDPQVIATSGADHHPTVMPSDDPTDEVEGAALSITEAELAAADIYEAADYKRIAVRLKSGRTAWVYIQA